MSKDKKEYGYEGEMAMTQLKAIMQHAEQLHDMLKPDTDLPEWVQSKITLAYDYIQTAADYMATELDEALVGNQHKIDANKNGKIDAHDFGLIRAKDGKPPFSEPYSRIKVHKDEYGNVIKNVAKRLAKKGMAANEEMSPQEAYHRKHGFYSYALKAPTPDEAIGHAMNTITAKYAIKKKKTNEEVESIDEQDNDDYSGIYTKQDRHGNYKEFRIKKHPLHGYAVHLSGNAVVHLNKDKVKKWIAGSGAQYVREEVLDELSKGLLNRYQDKNEVDRERLASGLWYPKGEAGATEKQKKDSAKLGKRNSSSYLAFKKADPEIWTKYNPPHLRGGDKPARVHATEEAPTNAAGGGNIAGIGVGPKGEPGVKRSAMDKYKKKNAEGAPKAGRKTFNMFMKDE